MDSILNKLMSGEMVQLVMPEGLPVYTTKEVGFPEDSGFAAVFSLDKLNRASILVDTGICGELDEDTFAAFILHELTHYKQWKDGRMASVDGKFHWEGNEVSIPSVGNGYASTPWEKEAFDVQAAFSRKLGLFDEQGEKEFWNVINSL